MGIPRRSPVVNGIFYPNNPEILVSKLASYGLQKTFCPGGQAILAPHAAWDLTGGIAALAFSGLQEKKETSGQNINRVLLLGTCHNSDE